MNANSASFQADDCTSRSLYVVNGKQPGGDVLSDQCELREATEESRRTPANSTAGLQPRLTAPQPCRQGSFSLESPKGQARLLLVLDLHRDVPQ